MVITGGARVRKDPTPGELRDPVSIIRSTLLPDGLAGFDQSITPYADVFAKVFSSNAAMRDGENNASNITHEMIVRQNDTWTPAMNDYVVYKKRMFKIMYVRDINFKHRWWVIFMNEEGSISQFQLDNTKTVQSPFNHDNPEAEPAPARPDFPLWTS
jgi:hypothetical protein